MSLFCLVSHKPENHFGVLTVSPPGPVLSDVILVDELKNEFLLVTDVAVRKVSRSRKDEFELHYGVVGGHGAHARLIVRWTIVGENNGIDVETVEGDHLFHIRHRESFHDCRIGGHRKEFALHRMALVIFAFPFSGKALDFPKALPRGGC